MTRAHAGRLQVLVFDHANAPEAGTQVPAGSIDPGESPEEAVLREAREEAGLTDLALVRYLGRFSHLVEERRQIHERHVFHLTSPGPLPELWEHDVSGEGEDRGMRFVCFWLDVDEAARVLSGGQGAYLQHLSEE